MEDGLKSFPYQECSSESYQGTARFTSVAVGLKSKAQNNLQLQLHR